MDDGANGERSAGGPPPPATPPTVWGRMAAVPPAPRSGPRSRATTFAPGADRWPAGSLHALLAPYYRESAQGLPRGWVRASAAATTTVILAAMAGSLAMLVTRRPLVGFSMGALVGALTVGNAILLTVIWQLTAMGPQRGDRRRLLRQRRLAGISLGRQRSISFAAPTDHLLATLGFLVALGCAVAIIATTDEPPSFVGTCDEVVASSPCRANPAHEDAAAVQGQAALVAFGMFWLAGLHPFVRAIARFQEDPPHAMLPVGPGPPAWPPGTGPGVPYWPPPPASPPSPPPPPPGGWGSP